MLKEPFFQLKPQKLELVDGFALNTKDLEEEMKQFNGGIDISTMQYGEGGPDELYRGLVRFFYNENSRMENRDAIMNMALKYPGTTEPSSVLIESKEELMNLMLATYQVSHFHFILGMKYKLKGTFPEGCCSRSTTNEGISLMDLGFPQTTILSSDGPDHLPQKERWVHFYNGIPFVYKDILGSVIVDPTSNQYKHELGNNAVFLKLGAEWKYHINPNDKRNFYPKTICSLDILKDKPEAIETRRYHHRQPKAHFNKAFNNPIRVPFNL